MKKVRVHYIIVKSIAALLLVTLVFAPTLSSPQKVYASDLDSPVQVVKDTLNLVATHATALATGIVAGNTSALTVKEYALDPLAYMVAKIALQSVTKSVVNWINSGFKGSPAFVTDLNRTLLQVSDTYASQFLGQLASNSAIHSPFQNTISQAVRTNYYQSTASDGFFLQNPYTLNKVTSNDAAFLAGDFTQGGWNAWLSTMQNPSNNPFGAQLLQQEALGNNVTTATDNQKMQWQWSGGFNSWRGNNCPTSSGAGTPTATIGNVTAPVSLSSGGTTAGATNGGIVTSYIAQNPSALSSVTSNTVSGSPTATIGGATVPVSLTNTNPCLFNPIQTPGSVIANSLNKAIGAGQDQLVSADEINEIVGALMGQLVNHVLGSGGLLGVSQPSAGGGSSYINQAADPSQYTSSGSPAAGTSISASFLTTINNQANQLQDFQTNWQKINDAASTTKQALTTTTCVPNAATIITSQINPLTTEAATALGDAAASLTSLNNIQTELIASASAGASSDQTTAVAQASSDYQTLLGSPTFPSADDLQFAQDQSADTGSSTPPSIYSQLVQLTTQAHCGT